MKNFILAAVVLVSTTAAVSAYSRSNSQGAYYYQDGYSPYYNQSYGQPYYYNEPYYTQPSYAQPTYYTQPSYGQSNYYTQPTYGQPTYSEGTYYNTSRPVNFNRYDQNYDQNRNFESSNYDQNRDFNQNQSRDESFFRNTDSKFAQDTAATENDRELNRQIRSKLSGWFSSGYNDTIILRTANGIVVIEGTVRNPEDIQKINDSVRKVNGVRNVNNRVIVKNANRNQAAYNDTTYSSYYADNSASSTKNSKYSEDVAATEEDRRINDRIRDKLSGWFSAGYNDTIVLKTANGMVVIEGSVERPEDIQKISDDVRKIDGVQSVTNRLVVSKAPSKSNY